MFRTSMEPGAGTPPAAPFLLWLAAAVALMAPAAPALADPAIVVSGGSPFTKCKTAGQFGSNSLNAEVEPEIAVNPINSQHMVAVWQQDRWTSGGARGIVSAYSADGGKTWRQAMVPGINTCSGGTFGVSFERASDPFVAVAPNGTVYVTSLALSPGPESGGAGVNGLMVSRSPDGGRSWDNPTLLQWNQSPKTFHGAPSIAVDPKDPRFAYATWPWTIDALGPYQNGVTSVARDYPDGAQLARKLIRGTVSKNERDDPGAFRYVGFTYFARTTDGGLTWEDSHPLSAFDGTSVMPTRSRVVVLNDGSVLTFVMNTFLRYSYMAVYKSTDHGLNFDRMFESFVPTLPSLTGTLTPDTGKPVRDGNYFFDVAAAPATNKIFLVWQEQNPFGGDQIAFSMSNEEGADWSKPVIINKTPLNKAYPLRNQAFLPSVAVAGSKVFVTYYDFRFDKPKTTGSEMTDYWVISCTTTNADCSDARSWGNETRLTKSSFDISNAPQSDGYDLGDYQGLVPLGDGVRALFAVATTKGKTNIMSQTAR